MNDTPRFGTAGLADSYTVKKFDPAAIAAAQAADDAAEAAGKSASVEDFTRAATQLFDASAVEEAAAEKAAQKTDKKRRRKAEKPESGPVQPSIKNRSLEIIEKSERRRRRTRARCTGRSSRWPKAQRPRPPPRTGRPTAG